MVPALRLTIYRISSKDFTVPVQIGAKAPAATRDWRLLSESYHFYGSLVADSKLGKGTFFTLTLPVS